jgi:hypothetical protein
MSKSKKILLIIITVAAFLRLWGLAEVPVSLFGDELDVGYHAYSILKTGRDYSGNFMPLHFQSLAEWRTPLYLYSVVPAVAVWGISALGVRLPAVIFGILGVFGMYLLVCELLKNEVNQKNRSPITDHRSLALLAALLLAISPWHIQYSRAAFEATMLLAFIIFGLYFFFLSTRQYRHPEGAKRLEGSQGKYLWLSAALFTLTPLIYSTAKLFAPALMLFLFVVWRKKIFSISKKYVMYALVALIITGLPTAYATLFTGGGQRFGYIGVFTNPVIEPEVGQKRLEDALMRGETTMGVSPTISDRAFHNKVVFWNENITRNILEPFSTDFLFIKGDINLRHSIEGMGQFYRIEALALILGLILFFVKFKSKKIRMLAAFWIFVGVLPASLTRDGGKHATRLILILPPLVLLISYGIISTLDIIKNMKIKLLVITGYSGLMAMSFIFYQHNYWIHNPWYSERWWHAGFEEAFEAISAVEDDYDRVIMSMKGEPVWIFFAGWSHYPPAEWQKGYPFEKKIIDGFGKISFIDKYYFGAPVETVSIHSLRDYINTKDLYLANASEVGENLIREPERTPADLKLIRAISYPSGEPAYYLFSRN